ncbi:sensor histidine kinase [Nocardiopsis coralliicola]
MIRIRFNPDRRVFGGRLYLGSTLWAAVYLAGGTVLWALGLSVYRDGIGRDAQLLTLAAVCALVLVRRTAPGRALALGTAVFAADIAIGPSTGVLIAYGDLIYAAAAWGRRRIAWTAVAGAVLGAAALAAFAGWAAAAGHIAQGAIGVVQLLGLYLLVIGAPLLTGWTVREHRERGEALRRQGEQRLRLAELDRASAIAEERGRVARELHDVIANHLSAVAVQSTAALSRRDPDPELVRRILGVIRENAVQGLGEMRRMIGVLRADSDDTDPVAPQLSGVDLLVRTARESGVEVALETSGPVRPLPAQVEAAGYRVVQEALTNAARYAEPARASVRLAYPGSAAAGGAPESPDRLVVLVENPVGAAPAEADPHGARVGLLGMRERAALLGGDFAAGAVEEGGRRIWRVRVALPAGQDGPRPAQGPDGAPGGGTETAGGGGGSAAGEGAGDDGGREGTRG